MNIAYVTTYNARDIHSWSGLGFTIANALEQQGNTLDYIGELSSKPTPAMLLKKLFYKAQRKDFDFGRELHTVNEYANTIKSRLKGNTDIIFSPSSIPIATLETSKPKVFYTDATFGSMIGFYKYLSNLSPATIKSGNLLEQNALDSCKLAIYSSDWAAQSAVELYGVDQGKVKVVPFGSNIPSTLTAAEVRNVIASKSKSECHLLFLAVDWERKGGDLALDITRQLNESGLKTTLHIVGIKEFPYPQVPENVINYGFVSKAKPEGVKLMDKLMTESHFLLLPTRADCTPVVFSEANSFGMPCLTTSVGGIPTIIRENENGKAFSLQATAADYATYVESVFANWPLYTQLSESSFSEYENRLNWNVAGKTITKLLAEL